MPIRGRLPSDARRITARSTPRLVADSPTLSAIDPPAATWPSCVETSPRRGHDTVLTETRGERHDGHGDDGPVRPTVQAQPADGVGPEWAAPTPRGVLAGGADHAPTRWHRTPSRIPTRGPPLTVEDGWVGSLREHCPLPPRRAEDLTSDARSRSRSVRTVGRSPVRAEQTDDLVVGRLREVLVPLAHCEERVRSVTHTSSSQASATPTGGTATRPVPPTPCGSRRAPRQPGRQRGPSTRWRLRRRPRRRSDPRDRGEGGRHGSARPAVRARLARGARLRRRRRREERRDRMTSSFSTTTPPSPMAPIASSGWNGTPSFRTTITSRGAPSPRATSKATGTPPRGRPATMVPCRRRCRLPAAPRASQVTTGVLRDRGTS